MAGEFVTVLYVATITGPRDAARAAIVAEQRAKSAIATSITANAGHRRARSTYAEIAKTKANCKKTNPPKSQPPTKWWTPLRRIIAGGAATIAFLAAALALLPRVSIEQALAPDVSTGSWGTFEIANTGYIPLTDTRTSMGICFIGGAITEPPNYVCHGPLKSRSHFMPWDHPWLGIDEKFTIGLDKLIQFPPGRYADISLIVSYKPWFLPWRMEKEVKFVTMLARDSREYWSARPASE